MQKFVLFLTKKLLLLLDNFLKNGSVDLVALLNLLVITEKNFATNLQKNFLICFKLNTLTPHLITRSVMLKPKSKTKSFKNTWQHL